MKARLTVRQPPRIGTIAASLTSDPAFLAAVGEEAAKEVPRYYAATARKHYSNLFATLEATLASPPFKGVAHGGRKSVRFSTPDGRRGQITTPYWAPLSKKYRRRKRKLGGGASVFADHYWRGTGFLFRAYKRSSVGRKVSVSRSKVRALSSGKVVLDFSLKFAALRKSVALDTVVRKSFVSGTAIKPTEVTPGVSVRNSVDRIVYFEGPVGARRPTLHRPFIAMLSARLGDEMRKSFKRL